MSEEVDDVVERARERLTPDEAERTTMEAVAGTLAERAETAVAELPVEADVIRVGSTARGTWLPGDRDVDLFVRFPADLDRDRLREYGLRVGHAVLPDGHEEYAEHPYVTGVHEGFDVDVVPCYDVEDASEIRSAVDRTPFHTTYVRERVDDELAAEVRLAKGFATGIGVYGSDLRTRGFSGYLVELLVLEYGSFRGLLETAANWHPPVELDPEDHGRTSFDDPLVVIDPTDPERNVAAVCSAANVARFQHYARSFLEAPSVDAFERDEPDRLDADDLREHRRRRATTPVAVRFPAPDLVDDDLYPQLRTSLQGIVGELERRGFDVLRSTVAVADDRPADGPNVAADDDAAVDAGDDAGAGDPDAVADAGTADGPVDAVLLVELEVPERPKIERHEGPPVHVREHAAGFVETYADDPDVYGPFIEDDRYVVERRREFATATGFLRSDAIFDVGHGVAIEAQLEAGYDVLVGADLAELLPAFGASLHAYFEPSP